MSRKERPEELSDDQLVETAKSAPPGDMRAFEQLVERYQRSVHTNCRYLGGSESDAEDLAQEVFIKAFFGLQRFEGRAQFKTWLQRIKVNHCLNHLRKKEG
ncbi:MAG TPA: sigma-70 family RNA polymerase sigma factor, partial [Acidobacteria bacterium]|nr:sigma-70 family RNA polymerase sigma factor [Acidobacteriota bacterium]